MSNVSIDCSQLFVQNHFILLLYVKEESMALLLIDRFWL